MRHNIKITFAALFLICFLANCGGNARQLSEEELETAATERFNSLKDTIRKQSVKDCDKNFDIYVNRKVDSIVIQYLKDAEIRQNE